jgi:hypothetical protein
MALLQSAARQLARPHVHNGEDHCPWCEQPISRSKFEEITKRIEAREREQQAEVTNRLKEQFTREKEQVRTEAAAAAEQRVLAARNEAALEARAVQREKLAQMQARLAAAEQVKTTMQDEMAALKDVLQRDKDAAVLAEKAKVMKLQTELADMQRKLEGKSAHELGEGSEIDLFEQLRSTFEGDRIRRVGKGVNGADVIHEVVHNGKVCGRIIYDAKNRNAWQNEFVNKLRADKLAEGADHAILSSNKFPKDRAQVHYQDGVIVAAPERVAAIVQVLRDQVVRMHELRLSKEGREQKSMEIYAFITSEHCRQLLDQVELQAGRMLELDTKEQEAHRRLWDQRKKLISSVQKAKSDFVFEIDRIIGTAGNGPEDLATGP